MPAGSIVVDLLLRTGSFETAVDQATGKLDKVNLAVAKQVDSLQRQAKAYSQTAIEAKLYNLALDGASEGQLKSAALALTQIDAQEKVAAGFAKVKTAALATGLALGALAIAGAAGFKSLIEGAGVFSDLADRTGASAEGLASYAVAASVAGVSMDSVGGAITKLAKNLTGVDEDSKRAGAALKALGVNSADLKKQSPEDALESLAKTFNSFEDGASKSAAAQAIFGSAAKEVLALFKELEAEGGRMKILTAEQIALADDYSDKQAKAAASLKLYASAAATQALPAITAFTGAVTEAIKEVLGVDEASGKLGKNTSVADFAKEAALVLAALVDVGAYVARSFEIVGKSLGALAAGAASVAQGEFKQALNIAKAYADDLENIRKRAAGPGFADRVAGQFAKQDAAAAAAAAAGTPTKKALPNLNFGKTAKAATDDPTKRLLDNSLKDLERQAKAEQDLLSTRNRMLDLFNSQGLISITDYYDARQAAAEESLTKQAAIFDKEIAALQAHQAATKKANDKAADQGKIDALQDKRDDALTKAGLDRIQLAVQEAAALDQVLKQYQNIDAAVLELKGDTVAAAAIRFDTANADLVKRTQSNATLDPTKGYTAEQQAFAARSQQALQALADQRALTVSTAQYNAAATESGRIQEALSIAESRIQLSAQLGAIGQLDALKQVGAARQATLADLEKQVTLQEAAARDSGSPALVLNAQKARLALQQLAATADPLRDKIDGIFKDSLADGIDKLLEGTESLSKALQDLGKSLASQTIKLASQDFATQIYGSRSNGGSGLVGLFDSATSALGFGGSQATAAASGSSAGTSAASDGGFGSFLAKVLGTGGSAVASTAAATAETAASTAATAALTALATAAGTAAVALGGSSSFSGLGSLFGSGSASSSSLTFGSGAAGLASWFDKIPFFDVGTNRVPRDMLAVVHKDEAIVPARYNPAAGGTAAAVQNRVHAATDPALNIVQNFTVAGAPPSRQTQQQLAAAAAQGVARGRRNL